MNGIPDYNSASELNAFLSARGMAMQKKFGQNFLLNEGARRKIAAALQLQKGDEIWEVGPGLGSMTKELLLSGARVTAFEIDRGFCACLSGFFADEAAAGSFSLVQGDVLKTWKAALKERGEPKYFFGNLPYNIAAELIAQTIEAGVRFEKCAFTVQKEVAIRMAAKEGDEDNSSFSVLCRWAYDVKTICDLGPANFWPRPNVDSRAVLFSKKENFPACKNPALFAKTQRALFSSRRKTVKNNLQKFLPGLGLGKECSADAVLEKAGVSPSARAEALSLQELLRLSDALDSFIIK